MGWRKVALLVWCLGLFGCDGSEPAVPLTANAPAATYAVRSFALGDVFSYAEAPSVPGFPQDGNVLESHLAQGDEAAMRRHAWSLWYSLTLPTASGLPVMLTWFNNSEVFGKGDIATPRRFLPNVLAGPVDNFGHGDPPTEINFYNQAYRSHVRTQNYEWRETLEYLQSQGYNDIVDFPESAIAVKTVWWPVRHDGLTAFPVWDNQPTRPLEWGTGLDDRVDRGDFGPLAPEEQASLKSHVLDGNEWGTFARLVAISPGRHPQPEATIRFFDPDTPGYQVDADRTARVVPLTDFYTLRLSDQDTVNKLNESVMGQMTRRFWGRSLTGQDYLALVAVHVTTRETKNWVWATFWWHDGEAEDRPPVTPPFAHFRMAVTQSADLPVAEDGGPNVTFNPYLEAGFSDGPRSNCMGCHQRAGLVGQTPQSVMPVHRGSIAEDDPSFAGVLRTHFLWSLVFRPRPQEPTASPPVPPDEHIPEP